MIELELTRICSSTYMPLGNIYMVGKQFKVWTSNEKRGKVEREVTYVASFHLADGIPVAESYEEVIDVISRQIYKQKDSEA